MNLTLRKRRKWLRDQLVVLTPAPLRRIFHAKPAAWDAWSFSRKVRWRCRNPDPAVDYRLLVDKYRVKRVAGTHFRVPRTYQFIESAARLDSRMLPATYVMKATHGYDQSMLVMDGVMRGQNRSRAMAGRPASDDNLRSLAGAYLNQRRKAGKELQYRFVPPGVIFEEYLDPVDYELQFFLFRGVCRLTMVLLRDFNHSGGVRHRLYNERWERLAPGSGRAAGCYDHSAEETAAPDDDTMTGLHQLCGNIDHVRADFYMCRGTACFGELTFTHSAGRESLLGSHEQWLTKHWPRVSGGRPGAA